MQQWSIRTVFIVHIDGNRGKVLGMLLCSLPGNSIEARGCRGLQAMRERCENREDLRGLMSYYVAPTVHPGEGVNWLTDWLCSQLFRFSNNGLLRLVWISSPWDTQCVKCSKEREKDNVYTPLYITMLYVKRRNQNFIHNFASGIISLLSSSCVICECVSFFVVK